MFKTIYNSVGDAFGLFSGFRVWSSMADAMHYLKKLWSGYQDLQRYRKEVKQRLLRQRSWKREHSPLSGHWTDRFLNKCSIPRVYGIAGVPFVFSPFHWRLVFPFVLLLGLLAYMPVMAKSDLDGGLDLVSDSIHPLSIGDRVPDLKLSVYQDGKLKDKQLSDYKGKLLIIDFWATWCSGCVNRLAEDEALQNELKDHLQFLLVNSLSTGDHQKNILAFLNRWQQNHQITIHRPMVMEDDQIIKLFPRRALPHYVWIDEHGIVRAITHGQDVTRENIMKAIYHQEYNLPLKTF